MNKLLISAIMLLSTFAWAGSVTSLGKVTVTTAGAAQAVLSTSRTVYSLMIQADPANTGTYMILEDSAGNVICKAAKGQSCSPPMPPSGVDLNKLKLDTDTNGDGAFVSYASN